MMFRLILVTLAALYGFLAWFGTPEMNPAIAAARAPAPQVAAALPAPVRPEAIALMPASVVQTAPPQRRFAGPPLVQSPEHAATAAPATAGWLVVSGDAVNLRAGPGAEHARVGALSRGTVVTAVGPTTGAWIEVADQTGQRGFVSARFLSPRQAG